MVTFRADYRCVTVLQKGGATPEPTPTPAAGALYLAQALAKPITPAQFLAGAMTTGTDLVTSMAAVNQFVGFAVRTTRGRLSAIDEVLADGAINPFGVPRESWEPDIGEADDVIMIEGENYYRYQSVRPINNRVLGQIRYRLMFRRTMMQRMGF